MSIKPNLLRIIKNKAGNTNDIVELMDSKAITFLNPYSYLLARKHAEQFEKIDKIYIDGIALQKVLSLLKICTCRRASFDMTSLAAPVFEYGEKNNKSFYLIGTKPDLIEKAVKNILNTYPDLNISGYRDGYFKDEEDREKTIESIIELNPDIVIIGMGAVTQEKFLIDLINKNWQGTGYTCGGFFHQTAESIKYYPDWVDKLNLRWAYRIFDEPKLFSRYFVKYPLSLLLVIRDYISLAFSRD